MTKTRLILMVAAVVGVVLALPGCAGIEDFIKARDTATAVLDETKASLEESRQAEAEARAKALELALELEQALLDGDAAKAEVLEAQIEGYTTFADGLDKTIENAEEVVEKADAIVAALDLQIEEWNTGGSNLPIIDEIAKTVLPFLPPEAQVPGVLSIGIVGLFARLVQRSKALNSLSKSMVTLASKAPEVQSAISANASTLDAIQTPTAKKAIDRAQEKRALPII